MSHTFKDYALIEIPGIRGTRASPHSYGFHGFPAFDKSLQTKVVSPIV